MDLKQAGGNVLSGQFYGGEDHFSMIYCEVVARTIKGPQLSFLFIL